MRHDDKPKRLARHAAAVAPLVVALSLGAAGVAQAQSTTVTKWSTQGLGAYVAGTSPLVDCATYNLCGAQTSQQVQNNQLYDLLNNGSLPVYSNGDSRTIFADNTGATSQWLTINLGSVRLVNNVASSYTPLPDGRGVTGPIYVYSGTTAQKTLIASYSAANVAATPSGSDLFFTGINTQYITIDYGPQGSGGAGSALAQIGVNETTFMASPTMTVSSIGNAHVGTTVQANVNVVNTNVSNNLEPQQNLVVTGISTPAASNSYSTSVSPGNGAGFTSAANLAVTHSGANSATVTMTYNSDGTAYGQGVTSGLTTTGTVSATGYNYAATTLGTATVNLGAARVGGATLTSSTTVSNTAATDGYSEKLNVTAGTTVGGFGGAASVSGIAAGGTTTLAPYSLATGTSGTFSGSQVLTMVSDGAGTSGLGTTTLGTKTVNLTGSIYQTATATVASPVAFGNSHVGDAATTRNISVSNTATGALVDTVTGSISATTGTGITGSGTLTGVASGATNSTSLTLTRSNATAGSSAGTATVALASHDSALSDVALGSQTVSTTGGVYNLAASSLSSNNVNLGAARVGDATLTRSITVANTASANYSEKLKIALGTTSGGFGGAAAGTVPSSGLAGGTFGTLTPYSLGTGTSGSFTGSQTISMTSDGTGTSGLGTTALASQTVNLTGKVYQTAAAAVGSTVNLGTTHRNAIAPAGAITVANTATGALVDTVTGNVASTTGSGFTTAGTLAGVAAGTTDSSSLSVTALTNMIGAISGTATLALASHNPDMADVALASQTATITGAVNDFATPTLAQSSGPGTLTGSGNTYKIDLGNLYYGQGATDLVKLLNALPYADSQAAYTDLLDGSFTIVSGANQFNLTGLDAFTGMAADGTARSIGITLASLAAVGSYDEKIVFNGVSRNSTSSTNLNAMTFEIVGTVVQAPSNAGTGVPEPALPATAAVALLGLMGLARRRAKP